MDGLLHRSLDDDFASMELSGSDSRRKLEIPGVSG